MKINVKQLGAMSSPHEKKRCKMWSETLTYLKDPHLVAKIQNFFGIEIEYGMGINDKKNNFASIQRYDAKLHRCEKHSHKCEHINGNCSNLKHLNSYYDKTNDLLKQTDDSASSSSEIQIEQPHYKVKNYFWYYLFLFGTELGDEIFYSTFIPFWFWNIDGAVGRRVVLVWAIVMTIGQGMKDIICWPRPSCPPAVRLQNKWSQEYGMPSTHAMIGISIPFSVVLFTMNRYIYSVTAGCIIATLWCALVCVSRLYLGMHTVLDVIAGLILAILFMIPLVPLVDATDYYILTESWALFILIAITVITVIYYPCSDRWTPTRGDTTMVVSVTAGVHTGAWLNYKTGALSTPLLPPPYSIIWPSYTMLGRMVLRTILGFCSVIATKAIFKTLSYATACAILKVSSKDLMNSENHLENKEKVLVDLVYKYITCFMIGVNTVYLLPNVFTIIGIERPTFYTEM